MDDYSGQNQAPGTPPPPAYPPPPAPVSPPPAAPPAGYAPQPPAGGYAPAPAAPPKKKKTWLWIVLAIVGVSLLGCIGLTVAGGFAIFSAASAPADSIDAINQAALDGDTAAFDKYFDSQSVSEAAYDEFIAYVKSTPDYESLVTELGEEEADRMLREDILPKDAFVEELSAEFSVDSLEPDAVPFPNYSLTSSSIDNDTAEITIVTIEEGEEVTYILGMVNETYGDEDVWRVKEIKNIADMLEEDL